MKTATEIKKRLHLVKLDCEELDFITGIYDRLGVENVRDPEYHFTGSRVAGVWCAEVNFVYAPDGNIWDGVYVEYHFAEKELLLDSDAPVSTEDANEVADRIFAKAYGRRSA